MLGAEARTVNLNLAVIGQGAVTPAGIGVEALLHGQPKPVPVASLGEPEQTWPVHRVDMNDPAFARWQREPRLRRASPITFFLVETAEQAMSTLPLVERTQTGIIVAYSAGCLAYSRRFFEGILTHGQKSAMPALFPETVFNSPLSHVAAVLGLNGAAYALVGDETAWISALMTASIWLQQERVRQVLVLGVEEFDSLVLDAYRSARWLRRRNSADDFITSEGAAGLLVRRAESGDTRVITIARDGLIYRTKREAASAAKRLFSTIDPSVPCYRSARHNWLGPLEKAAIADRPVISSECESYLGEAFTASAAWNTVRALARLDDDLPYLFVPVWGLNHQLGSLELEKQK
jgi:3-oxoacyl-(acyl-carrier-protein) synthase